MRAKGWHNGGDPRDRAGYGIKFDAKDRDRHFDRDWESIVLVFGDCQVEVALSPSFWRSCSEVRSAELGQWLLGSGHAPWPKGSPPSIAVNTIEGNRFSARVIQRRSLL